jgi:type III secretion protein J
VAAVALAALGGGCRQEVRGGLRQAQAERVLEHLQQHGISGDKDRQEGGGTARFAVTVPRGEAARARRLLRRANLPRRPKQGLGEVFAGSRLLPTATEERALLRHALAGELSRTLESVDGVVEARVHVVLPERGLLRAASRSDAGAGAQASVLLRVGEGSPLARGDVRRLVAGAVSGLEPDAVEVVTTAAGRPTRGSSGGGSGQAAVTDGADPALVELGPFQVAPGSRGPLLGSAVALLVMLGASAAVVIVLVRREQALRRALQAARRPHPHREDAGPGSDGGGRAGDGEARDEEGEAESSLELLTRSFRRDRGPTAGGRGS